MKIIVLLLVALLACGISALKMRPVGSINVNNGINDSPFNGSLSLGTIYPNKWNQTEFTLSTTLTNVPLTSIWIFFSDDSTGKPIPSTSFQRASLTLSTSNGDLSVYNALTSSLSIARVFPATSPYVIPQGNLTLKVTYALNADAAATNASVTWLFTQGAAVPGVNYLEHASVFVPAWKGAGETSGDVTTNIPYDGVILWGVGNVLLGGQSVTLFNNATGAVICTSTITPTGDMSPCTLSVSISKGTKVTVVLKSNSTGVQNNGGMDLYIQRIVPTTTATTATAATATTGTAASGNSAANSAGHAASSAANTAGHAASSAANSAGHAASNGGNSAGHAASSGGNNGGNSGGHSGGNSGGNSGGHSGGNSGGNSGGSNGGSSGGNSGNGNGNSGASSGNGNGNSGANNGVTMGYSSGSSGSSGSSSGTGGFFNNEHSIFQVKETVKPAKREIKQTKNVRKSPKEVTLNDLKRKAMNMNQEVEEFEADEHFRVFEEKSSQKFL